MGRGKANASGTRMWERWGSRGSGLTMRSGKCPPQTMDWGSRTVSALSACLRLNTVLILWRWQTWTWSTATGRSWRRNPRTPRGYGCADVGVDGCVNSELIRVPVAHSRVDRLLPPQQLPLPPPFSQSECQELLGLLRSFNGVSSLHLDLMWMIFTSFWKIYRRMRRGSRASSSLRSFPASCFASVGRVLICVFRF